MLFRSESALPYFIYRLLRGAYIFENLAYLELRYTPYLRTDESKSESERIEQMANIVDTVGKASEASGYPIITKQILCTHTRLSDQVNRAIVKLASEKKEYVCAIDIAGGDTHYRERIDEFVELYKYAHSLELKTTGHLYETPDEIGRAHV